MENIQTNQRRVKTERPPDHRGGPQQSRRPASFGEHIYLRFHSSLKARGVLKTHPPKSESKQPPTSLHLTTHHVWGGGGGRHWGGYDIKFMIFFFGIQVMRISCICTQRYQQCNKSPATYLFIYFVPLSPVVCALAFHFSLFLSAQILE